jgi:hypothetical protein
MADVIFVLVLIAFFALAVLFVKACDRIIGADADVTGVPDEIEPVDTDQVAA